MLLGLKTNDCIVLDIGEVSIDVITSVELLGVTMNSKLKFDQLVAILCQRSKEQDKCFL